jgi:hypothetical protein
VLIDLVDARRARQDALGIGFDLAGRAEHEPGGAGAQRELVRCRDRHVLGFDVVGLRRIDPGRRLRAQRPHDDRQAHADLDEHTFTALACACEHDGVNRLVAPRAGSAARDLEPWHLAFDRDEPREGQRRRRFGSDRRHRGHGSGARGARGASHGR